MFVRMRTRQLGWFVILWACGVLTVGVMGLAIKIWLGA